MQFDDGEIIEVSQKKIEKIIPKIKEEKIQRELEDVHRLLSLMFIR